MSFNAPADFTKKMLWGLLPIMTCSMMLNRRTNLASFNVKRSFVSDCNYMRLVLPVMALLVFMSSASAKSLPEPLSAADIYSI